MKQHIISDSFQKALKQLNPAQRQAVETIEGPVMVVAGPGTGKTQVLALRVGWILKQTDTPPPAILVLTFTEAAAQNMRRRLVSLIGPAAYGVKIATFHGWCSSVIRDWPEYFPLPRGSQPLGDLERHQLFESLIAELPLLLLRPLNDPLYYLRELQSAVSQLKRESVSPEKLQQLIEQAESELSEITSKTELTKRRRHIDKQKELQLFYTRYQQSLNEHQVYDYDDMINFVIQAFAAHPDLLAQHQEEIHYFMVDEYQDTNTSQNLIVELLSSFWGDQANVCVVGDPHQSIYRFQGASQENVLGFMKQYPSAQVVALDQGYRCPQPIYDVAHHIISHNTALPPALQDADQPLQSHQKDQISSIKVLTAPSQLTELVWVAEQIRELLDRNVAADQVAVLFRHNRDSEQLQAVLQSWNIPFTLDEGRDALQLEPLRQLLTFFETIFSTAESGQDGTLYEVLQYGWWQLPTLSLLKVARVAGQTHRSLTQTIEAGYESFASHDTMPQLTVQEFEVFESLLGQFREWWRLDSQAVLPQWFETVIRDSGYLDWVRQQPDQFQVLGGLQAVFQQLKTWASAAAAGGRKLTVPDFLANIATLKTHHLGIPVASLHLAEAAVQLTTVHKAKGREWQHVFVIHCQDGKWGSNRSRQLLPLPDGILAYSPSDEADRTQEERRLFYVALTRASRQVVVSYPETVVTDSRTQLAVPSQFVVEMQQSSRVSDFVTQAPATTLTDEDILARLLTAESMSLSSPSALAAQRPFWQQVVADFVLSPTSLNSYLRDPQEFVERVLLRLPQAKAAHLSYGTAMHAALEFLYSSLLHDKPLPALAAVNHHFSTALQRELLTETEFTRRQDHGLEVLARYYQLLTQQCESGLSPQPVYLERFFGTGSHPVMLGDIPLKGRFDRVDWIDMSKKTVEVIDYKTGSPKSANWINGAVASQELSARERALPEAIRGPYKRQLLFYKLLADLDPSFSPTVTHGSFVFVEGEKQPVIRRFEYLAADLDLLKQLIVDVTTEIRELRFLGSSS